MAEFIMPKLGADMTAGTLIGWLKKPGERVARGDIIAEVDTDKGVIEVEVFADGVIEKFLVEPGAEVPVGTALAIIKEEGGEVKPEAEAAEPVSIPGTFQIETVKPPSPETPPVAAAAAAETPRLHASPLARKLAKELGVDLKVVKGTGPGGRIQREDVELAAVAAAAVKESKPERETQVSESKPASAADDRNARMRRAIAAAMALSKREIPHYYLGTEIDMSRALEWLAEENARRPVKERILYGVLLVKAVALALRQTPELNATWENDRLNLKEKINVGTAISLRRGGLVAPALHETDQQSLGELMKNMRDLVGRARAGALRSSELSDSTITVTSLGEQSVETVFGVIYPPQVALVGFGKIYESVSVIEGRIKGCRKINATLAADHRASDGHRGALFLVAVDKLLQEPEKL